MTPVVATTLVLLAVLVAVGFGPSVIGWLRGRRLRRGREPVVPAHDPGRELRAERKARELMQSVVSSEEYGMYLELGFISVEGEGGGYAYLIYPHRPIVAYETRTRELLSEYCVAFPDGTQPAFGSRLPDADDVLAKWMALHGGERELIEGSNMHAPGRQIDPGQIRRDLVRLHEWRARWAAETKAEAEVVG